MVLTIAGYAVPYIHLDRKLRATLLAADETPRPEIAYILRDELAMHPAPDGCQVTIERIQQFIASAWPSGKRSPTAWSSTNSTPSPARSQHAAALALSCCRPRTAIRAHARKYPDHSGDDPGHHHHHRHELKQAGWNDNFLAKLGLIILLFQPSGAIRSLPAVHR